MKPPNAPIVSGHTSFEQEVWLWLDAFSDCVRSRDFDRGRGMFRTDAVGFGSVVKIAQSLDDLVAQQWGRVWPRTSGFCFQREDSAMEISADGLMAAAMVCWRSSPHAVPVEPVKLDRRGRATIVLCRGALNEDWKARFTHFSFEPTR